MKITLHHNDRDHSVDLDCGIDLSINNRFDGKNPIFYNAMQPRAIPVERDGFIGAVNRGGGCNVSVANVDIHCTGTHTECVGHIDDSGIEDVRLPVNDKRDYIQTGLLEKHNFDDYFILMGRSYMDEYNFKAVEG